MSKNLELFNQQTAEIFAVLWDNFPVPQVITYKNLTPRYLMITLTNLTHQK